MPFVPNPTLALGLNGLTDNSSQLPFLDLMKQARPWRADMPGDDLEYVTLKAGGYLDANGWPTHLPEGANNIQTMWPFPSNIPGAEGPWVLTYEGAGTLHMNWVDVTHTEAGRIEFNKPNAGSFWMSIEATDPSSTGNYIRNIRIVPAKYEELADAGEIFNPNFLAVIRDARQLRFMDWMETNWSPQVEWADRPKVDDFSYAGGASRIGLGIPLEVLVALANKVGCNPWFNIPCQANDEYIENFATYVRDNLAPGLVANVEFSNETWNFGFGNRPNEKKVGQYNWLAHMAGSDWGRLQGVTTDGAGYAVGATSITLAPGGSGGALASGNHISIAAGFHPYDVATGLADVSTGGVITLTSGLEIAIPASPTPVVENLRGDYWIQASAKRAVQVALIWNGVFGAEAGTRLYHHIGVQQGWQGLAQTQLDAAAWETAEPEGFIAPNTVFNSIAVTTYFGGSHVSQGGFGVSISIGSPAVATRNNDKHYFTVGQKFRFYSDHTLPTGVTSGEDCYVVSTPTDYTFTFSKTPGGPEVNTSGSQSGSHQVCWGLRLELIEELEDNPGDIEAVSDWLTDRLINRGDIYGSVPQIATSLASFRTLADSLGLDLSCYEGGNHEHHLANVPMSDVERDILTPFYVIWSYSPQIAAVYEAIWEVWADVAESPFMQFTDVATPSIWGSFPMLRSLIDSNARADKLYELNATYPAWGGMTGGDHFLPQVVEQLEDGETAEFNVRGGRIIGGGYNSLVADRPLSAFALSRDGDGHLHVGNLEVRNFTGNMSFPST